jgi:mono/diheme cytochrome c family protein
MRRLALVVLLAAALGVAACGGGGGSSSSGSTSTSATTGGAPQSGKQLFASVGCSGCHTLKDAGATGHVGPDLDRLKPSVDQVEHQVTNGGGGMPAFRGQLSDAQIKAVAQYVAGAAGR